MPNIMEISGYLGRPAKRSKRYRMMDLRDALSLGKAKKKRKKVSRRRKVRVAAPAPAAARKLPGPSAERSLELAEKFFADGKSTLALMWARQAETKGKAEGRSAIVRRAQEIVKAVRGNAALKMMAGLGDVDGVVLGRLMGLW